MLKLTVAVFAVALAEPARTKANTLTVSFSI